MKKHIILPVLLIFMTTALFAQKEINMNQWLKAGPVEIYKPAFSEKGNLDGEKFKNNDLLESLRMDFERMPRVSSSVALAKEETEWKEITIDSDSLITISPNGNNVMYLASYIEVDQWTKLEFNITTGALFEFYIDGEKKHTKETGKRSSEKCSAQLHRGKHLVGLKLLNEGKNMKFHTTVSYSRDFEGLTLTNTLDPTRELTIHDILDGKSISSARISSSGKYVLINYTESPRGTGKSMGYTVLKKLDDLENETVFRNPDINKVQWLPKSERISYTVQFEEASNLYVYDVESGEENIIARDIEDLGSYTWAPNEAYIVYSTQVEADDPGDLKRIYGNEDRIPGFRDRSFLHLLNVKSGHSQRITAGNLSTRLHDIRPDSKKILFSTSYPDYTEVPFSRQNLYEMDVENLTPDTIWKDKRYSGRAEYSPEGNRLLVQGGPLCFGDVGRNVSDDMMPNNYDSQLYLYDLQNENVKPLTKTFAPSVNSADWITENRIYLSVTEKDYGRLYLFNTGDGQFEQVDLEVEVLGGIDFSDKGDQAVYTGTGMTMPEHLYALDLKNEASRLIDKPKKESLAHVQYGPTEEWNFTNSRGRTIDGRVYYPPNYDPDKTYPVIVYYYGGTTPTSRSFDGRYPKNIWAGKGYIVYVLQPSGATGYGQEFSALHVNGWGKEQVDDIIEGTKKFLDTHPSADEDNVGAIGASYGGYTTMMLQTRTDIFKTAVAHAGISSISSYWGEGYWGYTYSAVASAHSYPWNNKDLYVEQSPLFNADDFSNSILLLHGAADTNVPVGESKQYYAALKILGKDVEMVLVENENHWIIDYDKRIKWHYTITSWFDSKLKDQPQQWEEMYPEKNLD
ncbi:MAG: prolyl oligopeptidase family serine peptidase [Bacteroidales bacterium]